MAWYDPTTWFKSEPTPAEQSQTVLGVGSVGQGSDVAAQYQTRLGEVLAQRQRAEEAAAFDAQRQRILGAMQPSTVASQAARGQAQEAGAATLGAARSLGGVSGVQTAALGALGAGQAQQAGYAQAAQVRAAEQQRNNLAQMQLADMLRRQEFAQIGLERGDFAQALGAQRALLAPELELQQQYAEREAERTRRREGAIISAVASAGAQYAGTKF